MSTTSLVRIGAFGQVGRYLSLEGRRFRHGDRVVCRTSRGLELGEVLGSSEPPPTDPAGPVVDCDGDILRGVTSEDDLLTVRLNQKRLAAIEACETLLAERQIPVTLMEVEQTLDGGTLVFYFLGEMSPEVEAITAELAAAYEQTVQMKQFAKLLEEGCGPHCGTDAAEGCGTGCSSCAVACGIKPTNPSFRAH